MLFRSYADSMFFASISGDDVTFRKTPNVFPWWIPVLVAADVAAAAVVGVWIWLLFRKKRAKAVEYGLYSEAFEADESDKPEHSSIEETAAAQATVAEETVVEHPENETSTESKTAENGVEISMSNERINDLKTEIEELKAELKAESALYAELKAEREQAAIRDKEIADLNVYVNKIGRAHV